MYGNRSTTTQLVGSPQILGYESALTGSVWIYHVRKLCVVTYECESYVLTGSPNPEAGM